MFNQTKIRDLQGRIDALKSDVVVLRAENIDFRDKIEKLEKFLCVKRRDVLVPRSVGLFIGSDRPAGVGWEYVKKEKKRARRRAD